jgi:hypothetical protein
VEAVERVKEIADEIMSLVDEMSDERDDRIYKLEMENTKLLERINELEDDRNINSQNSTLKI